MEKILVVLTAWKKKVLITLLFAFVAISLLAPIASNRYLPAAPDFASHTALITQAKMAYDEGQFPLRVAPWLNEGLRDPFYQFYSPLTYLVAGALYKWVIHASPFIVYKVVLLMTLLLAGIYMYRLTAWLTKSEAIGILAAVAYLMAPYYIININIRGDLTESLAQGIVPMVVYYTLKAYHQPSNIRLIMINALAWFILMTTHLLTFIYTSMFVGLLIAILTLKNITTWKNLLTTGLAYAYACLLGLWYLAPVGLTTKYLHINDYLASPFFTRWLTPLPSLISITAISPIPLPGNHYLPVPLYSAVGWPMLIAAGLLCYFLSSRRLVSHQSNYLILPLLIIFFLAFFMVWTPINFWIHLPKFLAIAQFSYRLLTQVMWIGALLFSLALLHFFTQKMDERHVAIGLLLLGMASSSWLMTNPSSTTTDIYSLIQNPQIQYGQTAYLVNPKKIPDLISPDDINLPLVYDDKWLLSDTFLNKFPTPVFTRLGVLAPNIFGIPGQILTPAAIVTPYCLQSKNKTICNFSISSNTLVQLPILYYPNLLDVCVNGQLTNYLPIAANNYTFVGLQLSPKTYDITVEFVGIHWANWFSTIGWILLITMLVLTSYIEFFAKQEPTFVRLKNLLTKT